MILNLDPAEKQRLKRGGVVLLLSALAIVGCRKHEVAPPQTAQCVDRSGCDAGSICTSAGFCAGCETSGQCLLKESCNAQSHTCVDRPGWGTQCQLNDSCAAGQWCMQGLCTDRANVHLCPSGENGECPQGQRCNTANSVCEEDLGCAVNGDCGAREVCNTGSHVCIPSCTVETQADVCAAAERCVNSQCVQCDANSDCAPGLLCDAAGKCSTQQGCYSDRDCLVPLVCYQPTGTCVDKPPPCVSDADCEDTQRCQLDTGNCVPRACQPDVYEPNNTLATAYAAKRDIRYSNLTLCLGDVDEFSMVLQRSDQIGVVLDADPYAEDTFSTQVQDATGRVVGFGKLQASYVAPASGTYYVAISSTDPNQPYDVRFLVSRGTPCDDDGFEPNDTPSSATAVNAATQLDGAICPQDVDYFILPATPAGNGVRVSLVNYNSAAGLLRICLLDGTTELGCSEDLSSPKVELSASAAPGKALLVRVDGVSDRNQNSYTLKVEYP